MASSEDPLVNGKPISSLRVVDLKKECDKRSLSKSGSKTQLVERLKTQLLIENLGSHPVDKDVQAPNQKLQEEDCQNEFIKQYLAQQRQLIEMNSSSQESDHSGDDSPQKHRPTENEPLIKQPATLEISPEKHPPEQETSKKAVEKLTEQPADQQKSAAQVPEPPKPTDQVTDQANNCVQAQVTDQPSQREKTKAAEDSSISKEPDTTEQTEVVEEKEQEPEMGRSRRRSSRKEEPEKKAEERVTRRSRSSRSSGGISEVDKSNEAVKNTDEVVKEKKEVKVAAPEEDKENDREPVDTDDKDVKMKTPKEKEPINEKVIQEIDNDSVTPKEEAKGKGETEVVKEKEVIVESKPEAKEKEQAQTEEKIEQENQEPEKIEQGKQQPVKEDDVQEQAPEKVQEKVNDIAEEQKDTTRDTGVSGEAMATSQMRNSRDSSSRSRSRSATPPSGKKRKPLRKLTEPSRQRRRSSSSSSSSSDSSPSTKGKKKHKKYSSSSSSSRSRSRSRSPVQKKLKKTTVDRRGRKDRPETRSKSSSSSGSRSRSPPVKKKTARAHSSSSSSRSRSPVTREPVKDHVQPKPAVAVATKPAQVAEKEKRERSSEKKTKAAAAGEHPRKDGEKMETDSPSKGEEVAQEDVVKVETKAWRKISLTRKPKEAPPAEGDKAEEPEPKTLEDKPAKKRKWGSRSTSTAQKPKKISSMPISTESLKNLIPEIKPALKLAPEPILEDEMDYEDDPTGGDMAPPPGSGELDTAQDAEDTRSVKIQRTVTQDVKDNPDSPTGSESESEKEEGDKQVSSGEEEEEEGEGEGEEEGEAMEAEQEDKDKGDKQEEEDTREIIKTEVKIMTEMPTDEEKPGKTITKTLTVVKKEKKPEIKVIRRLDSKTSTLVKPDEPEKPRRSPSPARNPVSKLIHIRNLVRPFTLNQLKELLKRTGSIDDESFWIDKIKSHCFVTYESEDQAVATRRSLHNTRWPQSNPKTLMVDFASDDQLEYYRGDEKPIPPPEKKDKAALKEKEQKEKERQQKLLEEKQRETERRAIAREKRMKERLEREAKERPKPVREWDRDKKSREDWDRTMQRSKSRSPRRRRRSGSLSRDRDRRRLSREDAEHEQGGKKKEKKDNEPPAKLLDDLFRKTKTTPCIYWLPLTAAQIEEKEKSGAKRPVLRQKQGGDLASPLRDPSSPESDKDQVKRPVGRSPPPARRSSEGSNRRQRNDSDSRSRSDRRR